MYNAFVLHLLVFYFDVRCYSSFTHDDRFMYVSFSPYFINMSILNALIYELVLVLFYFIMSMCWRKCEYLAVKIDTGGLDSTFTTFCR